jgi:cytosine/uracil/thiamine/allantoin permease
LGAGVGSVFVFTRNPGYAEFLFPLLFLLPSGVAFTLVGAMVAPRYRVAIAICLAAWCSIQSLCVHIITQPSPGLTNYMHATGQTLGSVIGVASVLYFVIRARLEVTA